MTLELKKIQKNQHFIGRKSELSRLKKIGLSHEASVIIMYGRRRVGKTELLEQAFRNRNILKFEGIEGSSEDIQQSFVMRKLSQYANEPLLKKITIESWLDVFDQINHYTKEGTWTIYFEEAQWLAHYKNDFISQLKVAWDDYFRRNPNLLLVLCGSSPSFMINQVLHSKSFYNRSQYEFHLQAFSLEETNTFLKKQSNREVMNAYLTIGGVPEYLKKIKTASSVFTSLCELSFLPEGYFSQEYKRIFISSMAPGSGYQEIISFLSQRKFATRIEVAKHLKMNTGGTLTNKLDELSLCALITKYTPYNLAENSTLARYQINDNYLQFYFRFIHPELTNIREGQYKEHPTAAINLREYQQWLGYAFERYCRSQHYLLAKILGFSGVKYKAGVFYNRAAINDNKGYQIDLLFDRNDHVITLCEIKYLQGKVGTRVIDEFERKLERFDNKKNKTIHKVLITAEGADKALVNRHYFDVILTLDDLFSA
jgi:AAA+ ATPase superfamily predicted ATPase